MRTSTCQNCKNVRRATLISKKGPSLPQLGHCALLQGSKVLEGYQWKIHPKDCRGLHILWTRIAPLPHPCTDQQSPRSETRSSAGMNKFKSHWQKRTSLVTFAGMTRIRPFCNGSGQFLDLTTELYPSNKAAASLRYTASVKFIIILQLQCLCVSMVQKNTCKRM